MTCIFPINLFELEVSINDTLNDLKKYFNQDFKKDLHIIDFIAPLQEMDKEHYNKALQKCIDIIQELPAAITAIDFNCFCNEFKAPSDEQIHSLFRNIPSSIDRLMFNASFLEQCSSSKRREILRNLPASVTHLVLRDGSLKNTFKRADICTIPSTIQSLSLDNIALIELPFDILNKLSQKLKAVILSNNKLNTYNPDQVARIISNIECRQLLLPNNNLGNFGPENLKSIFSAIGPKISVIDLQNNKIFGKKTNVLGYLKGLLPDIDLVYMNLEGRRPKDPKKLQAFKDIFPEANTIVYVQKDGKIEIVGSQWISDKELLSSIYAYVTRREVLSDQSIARISPRNRQNERNAGFPWREAQCNPDQNRTRFNFLSSKRTPSTESMHNSEDKATSSMNPESNQSM